MHSARASACQPQPFVQTGRRRTWCLYLHSVHSRRSEIFFVVFAWRGSRAHVSHVVPRQARSQEPTYHLSRGSPNKNAAGGRLHIKNRSVSHGAERTRTFLWKTGLV
jgi:hypothetical protein